MSALDNGQTGMTFEILISQPHYLIIAVYHLLFCFGLASVVSLSLELIAPS